MSSIPYRIICLNDGKIYRTQGELAKELGVHPATVGKAVRGITKTVRGRIYRRYPKETPPTPEELDELRRQAAAEIAGL